MTKTAARVERVKRDKGYCKNCGHHYTAHDRTRCHAIVGGSSYYSSYVGGDVYDTHRCDKCKKFVPTAAYQLAKERE